MFGLFLFTFFLVLIGLSIIHEKERATIKPIGPETKAFVRLVIILVGMVSLAALLASIVQLVS